ncbi:MAG TPA: pyridoxamine 5'-phosphate oxidase family protein [Chloroflexota bacterium]|nr:pyridoxamine 5'-phosphate oxidase family protein [Chloroflexota bacterium]
MQALSEVEARQFLAAHYLGRVGCFSPALNRSYVVPVSYLYRDGAAYAVSLEGQKVRFLREHPQGVCLEVDEVDDEQNWTSIIATGRFEELHGSDRREMEHTALYRAATGPLRFALAEADIYRPPEPSVIWALRIEELSGRRERWDSLEGFRYW